MSFAVCSAVDCQPETEKVLNATIAVSNNHFAVSKNMDTTQLCDAAEYGIFVTKADETAHPTTDKLTETQHRLKAMLCLIGDQLDVYG